MTWKIVEVTIVLTFMFGIVFGINYLNKLNLAMADVSCTSPTCTADGPGYFFCETVCPDGRTYRWPAGVNYNQEIDEDLPEIPQCNACQTYIQRPESRGGSGCVWLSDTDANGVPCPK